MDRRAPVRRRPNGTIMPGFTANGSWGGADADRMRMFGRPATRCDSRTGEIVIVQGGPRSTEGSRRTPTVTTESEVVPLRSSPPMQVVITTVGGEPPTGSPLICG